MGMEKMFEKKLNPEEAFDENIAVQRIAKEKAEKEGRKEVESRDYEKVSDEIDFGKKHFTESTKKMINSDVEERIFEEKYGISISKIVEEKWQEYLKSSENISPGEGSEFVVNFYIERVKSDKETAKQFKGRDDLYNDFINDFSVLIKKHFESSF